MKKLTAVIAAAMLAASGAASADPPSMHGSGHSYDRADARVMHSDHRYMKHNGWSKGRHKGWKQRCGYRWRDGHRYHTCWRVRW